MTDDHYMEDSQGRLIPRDKVKAEHLLEDELVRDLVDRAQELHTALAAFRSETISRVGEFREMLAEEYQVKLRGSKGNATLRTYDGRLQIQVAVQDHLDFGPELGIAKELIDECIRRWSEGANDNLSALVNDAFNVNKSGKIDTSRVLGLRRLDIDDPEWQRAMDAISNAVRATGSKTYVRIYTRNPQTEQVEPIALDLARV